MSPLWRGSKSQKARLVSGLVLFVFAAAHFINHGLGLVSLRVMDAFDQIRFTAIRSWPGTIVLASALTIHVAFAFVQVLRRRSWRMPVWEALQLGLGFCIPLLLLPHIIDTRFAATFFGVQDTYIYELVRLWPHGILGKMTLLLIVWIHGCLGLHYWLRLQAGYARAAPVLLAVAVLIPFAAFAGLSVQGRSLKTEMTDPQRFAALMAESNWPDPAVAERLALMRRLAVGGFIVLLLGAAVAVAGGTLLRYRGRRIKLRYAGGPTLAVLPGECLLDVSRRNNVPHLSVCGGRGRCSTCRVLVLSGLDAFEAPSDLERATLASIGAGPRIRLACQARPRADATISPLLRVESETQFLPSRLTDAPAAVERDVAVLFVDMRGFTTMTERKLAFDVVYILNQFFNTVGKPIYELGGWITNYAGDGAIALFSDPGGIGPACRSAMLAAAEIDLAMTDLNRKLTRELHQPIRIAMGLHAGTHVFGHIGYRAAQSQSVVGLAMNVASRMEAMAKRADAQMAMSQEAADLAGLATAGLRIESAEVRGLREPIGVVFLAQARDVVPRLRGRGSRDDAARVVVAG